MQRRDYIALAKITDEIELALNLLGNLSYNVLGVDGYISRKQDGTTGYLFKNAHGDVVVALDQSKNILADYTYDAWGEAKATDAWGKSRTTVWGESNPIRYNGQYYDAESGMTYLRARYYDSGTRRFITEDPAKDGVNWYAYAGNNPVMFVDPSGLLMLLNYDEGGIIEYLNELSDDGIYIEDGIVRYYATWNNDKPVGTSLIRRILDDDRKCTFEFNDELHTMTSYDDYEGAQIQGIGSSTKIHFYTGEHEGVTLMDGSEETGYDTKKKMELAHELIHVLRAFGGYNKGGQKGTGFVCNNDTQDGKIEEFEVIGINYKDNNGKFVETTTWATTENRIRVEQGLPWRGRAL